MKRLHLFIILILILVSFSGCKKKTQVVLTTNFNESEVFRIEDEVCTLPEILVYIVNNENQYSEMFGERIWDVPYYGGTVESQYKESVLARLAQIKVMKLFAKSHDIDLSKEELSLCKSAAKSYIDSLSNEEISYMGVTEELIEEMYYEYALANKVYEVVTDEINPEISDDEARSVTVKSLLIKTYVSDANGNKIPFNESEKQDAYNRAYSIMLKIKEGTEFDVLAADYNEDTKSVYSFGRGVMPKNIEEAAYNLSEGQVSEIIETEYGYHILKCVSNFDEEQTDLNKEVIVKSRKEEAFKETYDTFVETLTSNLNEDLWNSIDYNKTEGIHTTSFFAVYDNYFG